MEYDIEQRKLKILELISVNGKVKVSELKKLFSTSVVTIRADLQDLEQKGLIARVHGGAISAYKPYYNMNFIQRSQTNIEEKMAIAEKLCEYISDNDTIMMNSGTSTLFAFRALSKFKNINIVTNSIAIATEAYSYKNINAILLGGGVNSEYQFTYGIDSEKQLSYYHADKAILSVDGISAQRGLSTYYKEEAELCRKMIELSDLTIILADHSKIGRTAFANITDIFEADYLITSNKPVEEWKEFEENGVKIVLS
jgi:DeoR/GlpR family transcriptional regulator of sugar metabolism